MIQTLAVTRAAEKLPQLMKQELFGKAEEWFPGFGTSLAKNLLLVKFPRFMPIPSYISTISLTDEIQRVLGWLESAGVHLEDRDNLWKYLLDFPGMVNILPEAVQSVRKHFEASQLIVRVYHDPEIEDRYIQICVRLKSYDKSVLDRLETAEAEFIDRLADEEGWLQLTTDFEEPEDAI